MVDDGSTCEKGICSFILERVGEQSPIDGDLTKNLRSS